jgi:hypothetical protein
MIERTVTEQQVIDAFNMAVPLDERMSLGLIFNKLFPELPKVGELILFSDLDLDFVNPKWRRFKEFDRNGWVVVNNGAHLEEDVIWKNYRRQTPAERGEG